MDERGYLKKLWQAGERLSAKFVNIVAKLLSNIYSFDTGKLIVHYNERGIGLDPYGLAEKVEVDKLKRIVDNLYDKLKDVRESIIYQEVQSADVKVKVNSNDPNNGYLAEKLDGLEPVELEIIDGNSKIQIRLKYLDQGSLYNPNFYGTYKVHYDPSNQAWYVDTAEIRDYTPHYRQVLFHDQVSIDKSRHDSEKANPRWVGTIGLDDALKMLLDYDETKKQRLIHDKGVVKWETVS